MMTYEKRGTGKTAVTDRTLSATVRALHLFEQQGNAQRNPQHAGEKSAFMVRVLTRCAAHRRSGKVIEVLQADPTAAQDALIAR